MAKSVRKWALIGGAVAVAVGAWFIWQHVNEGRKSDRWEALSRIERPYEDSLTSRAWLQPLTPGSTYSDEKSRDEHIKRLEDYLAREGADDDALAAHLHATIIDLEMTQYLGLIGGGASGPDVTKHLDAAQKHAEALRDEERFSGAVVNWGAFASQPGRAGGGRRQDAASLPRMILQRIVSYREWDTKYGVQKVEPDADPVVLLRTDEGDVRLQLFSKQSPRLTAAFLARVCSGGLTGVRIFDRRDDAGGSWVRVGDDRTKAPADKPDAKPTEDDRAAWDEETPGEAQLPDGGRYRILAGEGVVAAFHGPGETDDDPQQFIILTKDSPEVSFSYTPFGKVVEAQSMETVRRIAARATLQSDEALRKKSPKLNRVVTQFIDPVTVVRALVYEQGRLKECPGAAGAKPDEKSLETLVRDAEKKAKPAPPATPATPPAPTAPAPMSDEGMAPDAPMGDGAMDGGGAAGSTTPEK